MTIFTPKTNKKIKISSFIALFSLLLGVFSQTACSKSEPCTLKAVYSNDTNAGQNTAMVNYCTANNITYTTHTSGILYQIITPGTATKPNLCETVSMTYTGLLLNGTKFDSGTI
ncbi:FKBP-type peptidyl-prolyl cis-trans isomerase, partial [uncultured Agitococcus sp.]|uniref:FKBP-type peptidyl-prolyl cis-trans isomerase n=1 Tax=uncultured Agitococcus sp. TaxID=1506599 RepID=UPI00345B5CE7